MKFFKVLAKENLKSACKRKVLQQKQPSEVLYEKQCSQEACNLIEKETLALVFSFEFCEISKNTLFTEHLRTTASVATVMKTCSFIKKTLQHRYFSVNIPEFLKQLFYRTTVAAFELCFSIRKNFQQRKLVERFNQLV